jgi:hypothetical protein
MYLFAIHSYTDNIFRFISERGENVEIFNYLGSKLTKDGRCIVELNPGLLWQMLHLTRRGLFLLAK